jgi:hypothetical protein
MQLSDRCGTKTRARKLYKLNRQQQDLSRICHLIILKPTLNKMNKSVHRIRLHLQPPYATNQAAAASANASQPIPAPRRDTPFQRQMEQAERDIHDLINTLDFLKRELGEILHASLEIMKLVSNSNDYDVKKLLEVFPTGNRNKRRILPKPLSTRQIQKFQIFRNNIDLNNWADVQRHYQSNLYSMTALATSLVNPRVAGQIATAQNRIVVHKDFTGGVTFNLSRSPQTEHLTWTLVSDLRLPNLRILE